MYPTSIVASEKKLNGEVTFHALIAESKVRKPQTPKSVPIFKSLNAANKEGINTEKKTNKNFTYRLLGIKLQCKRKKEIKIVIKYISII